MQPISFPTNAFHGAILRTEPLVRAEPSSVTLRQLANVPRGTLRRVIRSWLMLPNRAAVPTTGAVSCDSNFANA
jgi:hypothetical protein